MTMFPFCKAGSPSRSISFLNFLFYNKFCFMTMNTGSKSSYEEAVYALNGLQSNAAYIQKARKERSENAYKNLTDTVRHLTTLGINNDNVDSLNTIHISGTKGKGSTCAFVESILRHHGYKTGFYSSPHLIAVNERIRINGKPLDKQLFTSYFWHVYDSIQQSLEGDEKMPSYFLFLTVMAFYVFVKEKVDAAVIEVGIGGLYDCTNFIRKPVAVGVTTLGLDHVSLLGNTVIEIAFQKAGIFKPNVPAFTVSQPYGAMHVLWEQAQKVGCTLSIAPPLEIYTKNSHSLKLGVPGAVQSLNASLALQLCKCWLERKNTFGSVFQERNQVSENGENFALEYLVPMAPPFSLNSLCCKGLQTCVWPGRFQKIRKRPFTFYLDGAHTFQSIKHCVRWFKEESEKEMEKIDGRVCRILLFNCTGERKAESLLEPLSDLYFDIALFSPNRKSIMQDSASDQSNFNVDPAKELEQCKINKEMWCHLMKSYYENEVSVLPETLSTTGSMNSLVKKKYDNLDNTLLFTCLNSAFSWLLEGVPTDHVRNEDYLHECNTLHLLLKKADHIQVLVTGSLHLVGGVLSVIDPDLQCMSVMDDET